MKLNLAATSRYDQRTVVYALECVFGYLRQEALVAASVIIAAKSRQNRAEFCNVAEQKEQSRAL